MASVPLTGASVVLRDRVEASDLPAGLPACGSRVMTTRRAPTSTKRWRAVVVSEFPTSAEAAAHAVARGMSVIAGPPNIVSGGSHAGNVSALELAARGHVQMLASDYYPPSLLQAVFLLHERHGWLLADAVRLVSFAPARIRGLDDRGEIAPGRRADLVIVQRRSLGPVIRETWAQGVRVF
jgi:alpha-D-ribose 1-methylphosphonate 5-triphosphate diphosphatase